MLYVVRDMSQIGAPRFQFRDVFQRALQPEMGWMGANSQTVQHQDIQALQAIDGRRWYLAQVGRVSEIVEAICNHGQPAVDHFERSDLQITCDTKRRAREHDMRHNLWQTAAKVCRLENIFENPADVDPGAFVGVQTKRAVAEG